VTAIEIAEELGKSGLCVCPNYLSHEALRETRNDMDLIYSAGGFRRAGVGHGSQVRDQVRSDEIHWLERDGSNTPAQISLWNDFDLLQTAFNRTLYLGLKSFEGHYASYAKGGFYERHLDSFAQENSRTVSVVIYLNQDWQSQDGGQLRVYGENSHTDISPVGGTMVCFMSQESQHEVLLSSAHRMSFTGWFKTNSPS
jgi:SM-20-related protein